LKYLSFSQVKSHTNAVGKDVNGVLRGVMNLLGIIESTLELNHSSAVIVNAASHVVII